jgi:indolepyruvate ferredoxin oxidoreductase
VDAARIATQLLDSSATGNIFLLRVAIQAGAVPVDPALMEHAIELNRVAVEVNLAAFRYGRS